MRNGPFGVPTSVEHFRYRASLVTALDCCGHAMSMARIEPPIARAWLASAEGACDGLHE